MARQSLLYLALALTLVACGGGDDAADLGGDRASDETAGDPPSSSEDESGGSQDGFVTVEGTTYEFTYDNNGRCGAEVGDGSVVSFGNVIGEPSRQVTFTYGLADETDSGEAIMQVIVLAEGGATQQYYSAVGFGGKMIGSIDSITRNGDTVRINGELQRVVDQVLVPFEAEATCDQ